MIFTCVNPVLLPRQYYGVIYSDEFIAVGIIGGLPDADEV